MDRAGQIASRRGRPRIRQWPVWSMPPLLVVVWLAVTAGYLTWVGLRGLNFHFRLTDIGLFCALLACGAFSVEMARRASEPEGVVKDVYAVWELPMVFLLPGLYALIVPAIRLTLTQFRVKRAPVYRRVYTAAAIGISYGCARLVYGSMLPAGVMPRDYLLRHPALWLVAAGLGALTQWVINQVIILTAVRLDRPALTWRELLGKEALHNDATELCAALLVAVGMTVSFLALIIALPLAILLQRSFRHAYLLHEAREDSKTGLLNAATWNREAKEEVGRAARTGSPLSVALLDLDRFKRINDSYGHLFGDEVLRQVANAISAELRKYDVAGRFGGEEFVILLPQTRAPDAFKIADRVRGRVARLPIWTSGGERVRVTVSIGVVALDAGSSRELNELLAMADAALYGAKASGRDQVQMISTSRGLSAVRAADPEELAESARQIWRPSLRAPGDRPGVAAAAYAACPPARGAAGRHPAAAGFGPGERHALPPAVLPAGARGGQLPGEGAASTAITSAVAV
jgi:diguanylate cyclase (GGDEF)-like protein